MNKYLKYGLAAIAILSIGIGIYFYILKSENNSEYSHQGEVYTCSMHPEIIQNKPGNCPICGMTLVKKVIESQADYSYKEDEYTCPMPEDSIFSDSPGKCPKCGMTLIKTISKNILKEEKTLKYLLKPTDNYVVGNYQTTTAKDTIISSEINLPGIVAYDPNSAVNISARINGRIEKMYVNYKYQKVNNGQKLFDLYSPELLTEQQNFIYLISNDAGNTSIIKAAKQKLLLYGMTNNQINSLISSKRTNPIIAIHSPVSGIVLGTQNMANASPSSMSNSAGNTEALDIKEGNYIKKGEVVFKLINTAKVWGIFNVLQGTGDLVKTNMPIAITSEIDEKRTIDARINFVETQLNPTDKSNRIRVYLNNDNLKLPIGLRLQGVVKTNALKGIWIQKQSMVSVGNKKIVFLKMGNGFKASAIKTGIEIDDFIQIIDGISVEDTIARNAQYLIDSESFIKTE